jgi:hypothetical protein
VGVGEGLKYVPGMELDRLDSMGFFAGFNGGLDENHAHPCISSRKLFEENRCC